jgi:hypothetical protein
MTHPQKLPLPRRVEAAHLSDRAFLRAAQLLPDVRATSPDMPFTVACGQALPEERVKAREAPRGALDAIASAFIGDPFVPNFTTSYPHR